MFWVISVYFNIRNTLPKSGTFLLGHPVYIYIYIYIYQPAQHTFLDVHLLVCLPHVSTKIGHFQGIPTITKEVLKICINRWQSCGCRQLTDRQTCNSPQRQWRFLFTFIIYGALKYACLWFCPSCSVNENVYESHRCTVHFVCNHFNC